MRDSQIGALTNGHCGSLSRSHPVPVHSNGHCGGPANPAACLAALSALQVPPGSRQSSACSLDAGHLDVRHSVCFLTETDWPAWSSLACLASLLKLSDRLPGCQPWQGI